MLNEAHAGKRGCISANVCRLHCFLTFEILCAPETNVVL